MLQPSRATALRSASAGARRHLLELFADAKMASTRRSALVDGVSPVAMDDVISTAWMDGSYLHHG